MEQLWQQIVADWPATDQMLDTAFRLLLAAFVGALPGAQREQLGMPAGLRTHMLVSIGAAIFVMAALEAGASMGDTTRVIQGLATGIGFVGAGAIMKATHEHHVHGLTTATSVWLTAALGTAVGAKRIWAGSVLGLVVLGALQPLERYLGDKRK